MTTVKQLAGLIMEADLPRRLQAENERLRRWKERAIELMLVNPTAEAEEVRLILEKEFGR